eukprot:COSAG01_NODE_47349_length_391_cov_0.873288_1_plen_83_part_01
MSSIGTIVSDKEIYLRDRAAGLYTVEPYFASKVICDLLPLRLLPPMLFSLIVYPLCSLHHGRMYRPPANRWRAPNSGAMHVA